MVMAEVFITLGDMLNSLKDAKQQGRAQAIPNSSATSQLLGGFSLKGKEHWDMPFPEISMPPGIGAIERVMLNTTTMQFPT